MATTGRARHPRRAYTFTVLDGPTYGKKERPPFWANARPLLPADYSPANPPDMARLPLDAFPLIEDIEVRLEAMRDGGGRARFGYTVRFFSPALGYVASFPWWDHAERDLARADFAIPLGSFVHPFMDTEQGWEIVIAARGGLVYILEGQSDQRAVEGYDRWFTAPKARYLAQWDRAIAACKRLSDTP